jgi:cytochrome c553
LAALKAAQSKSKDAMIEVSGTVADACAMCHEVYRDRGPAGSPERCTAAPSAPAPAQ